MPSARPNTHLTSDIFRPRMILCAGEEPQEFLEAIRPLLPEEPRLVLEHRCYRFWHAGNLLLAWTGIGSGCVEPLLQEYFGSGTPERVALVGTAGLIEGSGLSLGEVYFISKAFLGLTALGMIGADPHASIPAGAEAPGLAQAVISSSDLYYHVGVRKTPREVQLLDMEVAQFYWLCRASGSCVEYAAFKGPANRVGHPEDQDAWTPSVLRACSKAAMDWLGH